MLRPQARAVHHHQPAPPKPHLPPTACAPPRPTTWCSPRSRYLHLAWALWEKEQGDVEEARRLFKQGNDRNPRDAAILQVEGGGGGGEMRGLSSTVFAE